MSVEYAQKSSCEEEGEEEEDSNLDRGESDVDVGEVAVADNVDHRLAIAEGLCNAVRAHKSKCQKQYRRLGAKRRRLSDESERSEESEEAEDVQAVLADENKEETVVDAMDEEDEEDSEEEEVEFGRFVFEDTSPIFNFEVKESPGLREKLSKNRATYTRTFKRMNLDHLSMKIATDVKNGTATARHWEGFAKLVSQDKAKITLKTRIIPQAISYLKTACVPRVLDHAMRLLKEVGSEVNLSKTLLATLFASQMEGQSAVCENVASSLCVDMTRRIERVFEVASEYAKKRKQGDAYTPPEKLSNIAKMPIITKLHAAGTSGCGKTKIAEFIASMYGASEAKGNLVKLSMGNLSDVTATQSLSGTGPGLSGYGEKQSLAHKLKGSLRSHDPATECDLMEHLAYANENALGWIRSEREIADKLRQSNKLDAALSTDYASLYRTLTKADDGEATGSGTDFLKRNTELFVQGKFDIKIGAPIDIAAASFYARDPDTQLPVLHSEAQALRTFKRYYSAVKSAGKPESKAHWLKKTREENKLYRRSPDEEDNDEESKNAAGEPPRKNDKSKKRSRSEMEKSASGSMHIPEIGDYAHIAYPSAIVLIIDELDKAHLSVLPHIMEFMDTGRFESSCGEKFVLPCTTHLVVVITSNFGSAEIEAMYNDAIARDVENRVKTDDDALRWKYYDAMGELVSAAMVRKKYQSHYLARLGQIVPYAPISSGVNKKVCVKILTSDHNAVNRSSPMFHPLKVLPNHNGFVTQYENAKKSLLLSQSVATATMSMYCLAVALLGGTSAKSEELKNATVCEVRTKLQRWGSGSGSLAVPNQFVGNLCVMMDDVTDAGVDQLNSLVRLLSDFANGAVNRLDRGNVEYGAVAQNYKQLAKMIERGSAKNRGVDIDEDTLSAFVDMQQIFLAASIVITARVGIQNKVAIDPKKLRKDYITLMHRWYQHTVEKSMVVLGSNLELVCSSLVNASRLNQLARSQIAQAADSANKMRGDSEGVTGPISADTGLRGIKSAVVEKIVKPSDAVLQDSEIVIPLTSTPTTVAELLGANVVSCAYVFSEAVTISQESKKYIFDKTDVFEFPLEYKQHIFCVNLKSLVQLEPEANRI